MNLIERVQGRQAGPGSLRLLRAKSVYPFPALCSAGSPGNLKTIPVEILAWPKAHSDSSVAAYGKTQANFSASPIICTREMGKHYKSEPGGGRDFFLSPPWRWFTRMPLDVWMEMELGMRGRKGESEMAKKDISGRRDADVKMTLTGMEWSWEGGQGPGGRVVGHMGPCRQWESFEFYPEHDEMSL